jgi:hypothetical protein
MAQQRTVRFVDDLDGSEASGTITFRLDGREYEIDLSDQNADRLRNALEPFVNAARKTGGRSSGGGRGSSQRQELEAKSARSNREETAAIRQWAREHGHEISERGRIPKSVVEAFRAAS